MALPFDVLKAEVAPAGVLPKDAFAPPKLDLEADSLEAILARLKQWRRPLLLAGPCPNPGRGGERLAQLARALDLPAISLESPRGLRDPALGAFAEVLAEADGLFFLGKAVDFMSGFAGEVQSSMAEVVMVDPDPSVIGQARKALGERLVISTQANTLVAADALIAAGQGGSSRSGWREAVSEALDCRIEPQGESGILAAQVGAAVQALLDRNPETILICDGGEFGQWIQATTRARNRLINGPSGAIGAGLPYAIGAKLARPGAPVIALMGDGTAGFHLAEFETAAREQTAFVVIVGNDARWNAEQVIQIRDYGPERKVGCDLNRGARYDLAAAALGCQGFHVTEAARLSETLTQAMACGEAVCIDVAIEPQAAPTVTRDTLRSLKAPA